MLLHKTGQIVAGAHHWHALNLRTYLVRSVIDKANKLEPRTRIGITTVRCVGQNTSDLASRLARTNDQDPLLEGRLGEHDGVNNPPDRYANRDQSHKNDR